MDILSLGKANKAKRAIKKVNDRIGLGVGLSYGSAKKRIEFLESKDPKVNPGKRVSALETNTHINLNKHNLRVNTLLNHKRYNMKDMIVDDFGDATGIDTTQSVNLTHDVTNHLIKQVDKTKDATFISVKETAAAVPDYFTISSVSGNNSNGSKSLDLSKGVFTDTVFNEGKLELAKSKVGATDYKKSGVWISETADMGTNFKRLLNANGAITLPTGASATVSTATSADGVVFEAFKLLNADGSFASTNNRYVKVKIELSAKAEVQAERNVLDFIASDASRFTGSDMVTFDGSLKLKSLVVSKMTKDDAYADGGSLMRGPIDRTMFKSINAIEVKGNA